MDANEWLLMAGQWLETVQSISKELLLGIKLPAGGTHYSILLHGDIIFKLLLF